MLVLSRKIGEKIVITIGGERVTVLVTNIRGGKVSLGVQAPPAMIVRRSDVKA